MKIIIPASQSDIHRALPHARVLQKFGTLETHEVIYFCAPSVEQETHEAAKINGAHVAVMDGEPHGGWPVACNQMFSAIVLWLGREGNQSPFLFMELDMLPIRPGWASLLEKEYAIKGKPFLGSIVPYGTASSPAPDAPINYVEGDTMMMGCGIYPPHMHADERIRWAINNLGKQPGHQPRLGQHFLAFDVYLRNPARAIGMADTPLIGDQWNTGNYWEDGRGLHCEALPFDRPHRKRGGIVAKEAVVIHGCKDESLVNLLLADEAGINAVLNDRMRLTGLTNLNAWPHSAGYAADEVPASLPPSEPMKVEVAASKSDSIEKVKAAMKQVMADPEKMKEAIDNIQHPATEKPQPKLVVSKANLKTTDAELKEEIYEALSSDKLTTAMLAKKLGMRNNIVGMKAKKFGLEKDKHGFFKKPKKDEKGDWV